MEIGKVQKLRHKVTELRRQGGIKSGELEGLAKALGRRRHKRGKEPNWVSEKFRDLRPVSIPHHSSELNRYTAMSILNQLEEDLERYEAETKK